MIAYRERHTHSLCKYHYHLNQSKKSKRQRAHTKYEKLIFVRVLVFQDSIELVVFLVFGYIYLFVALVCAIINRRPVDNPQSRFGHVNRKNTRDYNF